MKASVSYGVPSFLLVRLADKKTVSQTAHSTQVNMYRQADIQTDFQAASFDKIRKKLLHEDYT